MFPARKPAGLPQNGGRSPRLAPIAHSPKEVAPTSAAQARPSPSGKLFSLPTLDKSHATLLPEGPYIPGDIIVYELLDQHSVWQWRVAKLLRIDSYNERVCLVVPLTPKNTYDPCTSNAASAIPLLEDKRKRAAQKAIAELETAQNVAGAREHALAELVRGLLKEVEAIKSVAGEIDEALGSVVPLLDDARRAVANITNLDLTEMRSYPTPPPIVMRVLQAVKIVLEDAVPKGEVKWKEVKQFIRGNDFVPRVRDYSTNMSNATYTHIQRAFINEPSFTAEAAARASAAAGPLFQWVHAQCRAAIVQEQIKPLKASHEAAINRMKVNEQTQKDAEDEQQRILHDLADATRRYQSAVYGFNFILPVKHQPQRQAKPNDTPISSVLAPAQAQHPFTSWEPSIQSVPTRILVSVIMAKCI